MGWGMLADNAKNQSLEGVIFSTEVFALLNFAGDKMEKYAINNIISDITGCAEIYNRELNNRNLLFIIQNGKAIDYMETYFEAERFQHLTG
jgi:hypothetical protein